MHAAYCGSLPAGLLAGLLQAVVAPATAHAATGPAGNIVTVAGNGTSGYSGDGGPATSAQLNNPEGISFDAAGNMYIAEQVNNTIRKVDSHGTITTFSGNGTAGYSGDGGLSSFQVEAGCTPRDDRRWSWRTRSGTT